MFFFGHLGIGLKLVSPLTKRLPYRPVVVGTVLPDLIDKPLYYVLSFITGKKGVELGWISGTRTIGHTAVFLLSIALLAYFKRSKLLAGLAIGTASHLLLDSVSDLILYGPEHRSIQNLILWPFTGWAFPSIPFPNLTEHLMIATHPSMYIAEALGFVFMILEWKKQKT